MFCKAFDSVWREAMHFKLREIGITGNIYNVIKNMYSNTFFCIRKNNFVLTTPIKNDKGANKETVSALHYLKYF